MKCYMDIVEENYDWARKYIKDHYEELAEKVLNFLNFKVINAIAQKEKQVRVTGSDFDVRSYFNDEEILAWFCSPMEFRDDLEDIFEDCGFSSFHINNLGYNKPPYAAWELRWENSRLYKLTYPEKETLWKKAFYDSFRSKRETGEFNQDLFKRTLEKTTEYLNKQIKKAAYYGHNGFYIKSNSDDLMVALGEKGIAELFRNSDLQKELKKQFRIDGFLVNFEKGYERDFLNVNWEGTL